MTAHLCAQLNIAPRWSGQARRYVGRDIGQGSRRWSCAIRQVCA